MKQLKLRRPDRCVTCDAELLAGTAAWWDREAKVVMCVACNDAAQAGDDAPAVEPEPTDFDRGDAGASAAREHARRKANREKRTREKHPIIGGALLAWRDAPQHEDAWKQGSGGEERVAASLARWLEGSCVEVIHDRRIPGSRANIDHLAVSPNGVYVIDAKALKGKVKIKTPLFGKQELYGAGRKRTKLLDGLDRQVAAVRTVLDEIGGYEDLPVRATLCFTDADLPLLGRRARGHLLLYPKGLAKEMKKDGPLVPGEVLGLARELAGRLVAA